MAADEPDDKIIRERKFKRSLDIDIVEFEDERKKQEAVTEEVDEALGDVFDPFSPSVAEAPGAVGSDGAVEHPHESDLVTELSVDGERKVNWVIMGSMIVLYSAISIQVGRTFDPLPGTVVLVLLAMIGFVLGEIWVPRQRMSLLGVTWIIISMKVLYGLALELRHWEIIGDDLYLGLALLFLVGVNILVAYRYDHDAIAAQSTLVLLAIGSTAGTEFGENGVALMILIATILLHGIAINRESGNLASLGIASSNLWIGMHAATSGFEIGQLRVLPLETPLLLFLLLMAVSALNAIMAAKFAKKSNWFSKGFETLGLGRPGLWGVSISLGMVGAFMVVASHREDLGYALGIVTFLGGAFGGSYLVVRGVEPRRVAWPLLSSASILTVVLLSSETVENLLGISSYQIFTLVGAALTGWVILRDQESVTDRVLWIGSVVILAILVLLVPAGPSRDGGGVVLLGTLSVLHLGTASLAIKRDSPSLSGVTALLPWAWLLGVGLLEETLRTVMLANDISDWNGFVDLSPIPLAAYLGLSSMLLFLVNIRMGEGGVNLASRFLGISELSSSIRDSGVLNLWSMGLWLPMLTIFFMAQFDGFTTVSIVAVLAILSGVHVLGQVLGYRNNGVDGIIGILAISSLAVQWRHGLDEAMMTLLCISIASILYFGEEEEFGLGLGVMSMPIIISIARKEPTYLLETPSWYAEWGGRSALPDLETVTILCTATILGVYLPRAEKMESMLKSAGAAFFLLVVTNVMALDSDALIVKSSSVAMFAIVSIWLISRAEIRSELRSVALRDAIVSSTLVSGALNGNLVGNSSKDSQQDPLVSTYNPKIAEMAQKRKKDKEKPDTEDLAELLTSDLSHTPVIGLLVIGIVMSASVIFAAMGSSVLMLIVSGSFSCIIVLQIRNRTRGLELDLPHVLGMEMPIALTISGICLALVTAHIIPVDSSPNELLDMAVASVLILVLTIISLLHQKNLLDRIEIALDWFVFPILAARLAAAVVLGGIPFPLTVDPFTGEFVEWMVPWLLLESLLVLSVLVHHWVNKKRDELGKDDGPDGIGIGTRSIAIVMLSFGPAGLLAAASAIYRSIRTSQPTGLGIALPGAVLAFLALASWNTYLWEIVGELLLFLGVLLIVACALTVPLGLEKWTVTLATDGHIFAIAGALTLGLAGGLDLPMLLVLMSTVVWVVGILQLRKSLRIWGLVDLVAALLCSIVFSSSEIVQPDKMFLGMIVLAAELGIVAWLGLANQEDLSKD